MSSVLLVSLRNSRVGLNFPKLSHEFLTKYEPFFSGIIMMIVIAVTVKRRRKKNQISSSMSHKSVNEAKYPRWKSSISFFCLINILNRPCVRPSTSIAKDFMRPEIISLAERVRELLHVSFFDG